VHAIDPFGSAPVTTRTDAGVANVTGSPDERARTSTDQHDGAGCSMTPTRPESVSKLIVTAALALLARRRGSPPPLDGADGAPA
jgi:hypothetical protein